MGRLTVRPRMNVQLYRFLGRSMLLSSSQDAVCELDGGPCEVGSLSPLHGCIMQLACRVLEAESSGCASTRNSRHYQFAALCGPSCAKVYFRACFFLGTPINRIESH